MSIMSDIGLATVRRIVDFWSSSKADSLISYTAVTRVEPICLIDSDLVHHELMHDIMQSLTSLFAGYYLQGMAISLNVGKINVQRQLDKLNPSRNPVDSALGTADWIMSMESYKNGLPLKRKKLALEELNAEHDFHEATVTRETEISLRDLANLSVGKMLNVNVTDGNNTATIPVSVRLMASAIPGQQIVNIMSAGNKDTSMKDRYHGFKSGRLEFIKDIVMCNDLVDAHKSNLLKDKTGMYSEILKRRQKNRLATLFSGNPSVATASNMLVCSKETAESLEGESGLSLKSAKSREKVFEETYLMFIVVVDREWDRVTIYHRGINIPTELSAKDLKASNKGNGPDISEILKAYQLSQSPML